MLRADPRRALRGVPLQYGLRVHRRLPEMEKGTANRTLSEGLPRGAVRSLESTR